MEVVKVEAPRVAESFLLKPPKYGPKTVRYPNNPLMSLLDDLDSIRPDGIARLYIPDGDLEIFEHKTVIYRLNRLKGAKPEAQIRILTGPVIEGTDDGENLLISLAEQGLIDLRVKSYRGYGHGFRVIETEEGGYRAFIEDGHHFFKSISKRPVVNLGVMDPGEAWTRCQMEFQVFDQYFKPAEGEVVAPTLPLVIPESKLQRLIEDYEQNDENMAKRVYQDRDEWQAWLDEFDANQTLTAPEATSNL